MSDFLANLIRRGAGLTPQTPAEPLPSRHLIIFSEAEGKSSDSSGASKESDDLHSELGNFSEQGGAVSPRLLPESIQISETSPEGMTEVKTGGRKAVRPAYAGKQSWSSDDLSGRQPQPGSENLAPLTSEQATKTSSHKMTATNLIEAEDSKTISAAINIREDYSTRAPILAEPDETSNRQESRFSKNETASPLEKEYFPLPQAEPRQPFPRNGKEPSHSAAHFHSDTLRAEVFPGPTADADQSVLRPRQSSHDAITSSNLKDAEASQPSANQRRVEVRIGRVDVRINNAPAQQPSPPRREPRGFDRHILARKYLDRNWY